MGGSTSKIPDVIVKDRVIAQSSQFPWSINNGTLANGNDCSIFVHKKEGTSGYGECTQFVKNLKLCRHPYLLHYIESEEDEDALYLVTEPITPLSILVKTLTEVDIALGLHIIATCLSFLHKDANISHNNIKLTSIFVNQKDNLWRLGGVSFACKHQDVSSVIVNNLIKSATPECPPPPEDIDGTFSSNLIHARDSWMMGHLINRLLGDFTGKPDGQLVKFKQAINKFYCSSDPRKRPLIESLLVSPYFKSLPQQALIDSIEFLQSITVKSEEERKDFFRKASNDLFHVPSELFQKYLMRLIFSDIVFSDENAREYLLPRLLSVKTKRESRGFYKSESYVNIMGPQLQELYKRRAKHTRLVLLRLTRWYVPYLPSHFVCDYILAEVLLGLKDTDDAIVMATFNALAVLTSFVGSTTVVGGDRSSNFYDAFPRGREVPIVESTTDPGITSESFVKALDGKIVNDSDLDSGQEYPKVHVSSQDRLQAEKEMRIKEFKKRREAQNKKKKTCPLKENQKLIEMAQIMPDEIVNLTIEANEQTLDDAAKPELVHEMEGFSMEYKETNISGTEQGCWNNDDMEFKSEQETNMEMEQDLMQETYKDHELREETYVSKDGQYSTSCSEERVYLSDSERKSDVVQGNSLLSIAQGESIPEEELEEDKTLIEAASLPRTKHASDGFSNWENGGWSEFESDHNIKEDEEIVRAHNSGEVGISTVSDFINLHEITAETEEDFFADMTPVYQAPKLL